MSLPSPREAIDELRWRWQRGRDPYRAGAREGLGRRVGLIVIALLMALEIGIIGYQIGSSNGVGAPEVESIQREAFRSAFDQAREDAAASAKEEAEQAGQQAGQQAGERAGARVGERRGEAAAERKQAALAAARRQESSTDEPAPTTTTTTPAPATTPTPVPVPAPTPTAPEAPCFDASGHPC